MRCTTGDIQLGHTAVVLSVASVALLVCFVLLFNTFKHNRPDVSATKPLAATQVVDGRMSVTRHDGVKPKRREGSGAVTQSQVPAANNSPTSAAPIERKSSPARAEIVFPGFSQSFEGEVARVPYQEERKPLTESREVASPGPATVFKPESFPMVSGAIDSKANANRDSSLASNSGPIERQLKNTVRPGGSMVLPVDGAGRAVVVRVNAVESVTQRPSESVASKRNANGSDESDAETIRRGNTSETSGEKAGETETIGVPPPREQPQFLRNDSILLEPGDYQWEIGLSYARNLNQSPIGQFLGDTAFVGNLRRVNRVLQMPLELRIGLTPEFQGSVSLPIGFANQEISIGGSELTDDSFGIGDLSLGLTRLIRQGDLTEPNVLGFLSLSIPTGQASLATSLDDPSIALGRGFYSLTTGLTFTKTFDPLVFFCGFGYQHNFETSFSSVGRLNPGNGGFYRLGVGYAVNSNVSLSTAFTGAFLGNAQINDVRLGGSSREPLSLRIAATLVNKKKSVRKARTVEPFVNLGLNEDATDTILGVTWTY